MLELSTSKLLGINQKEEPILVIGEDSDFESCVLCALAMVNLSGSNVTFSSSIWDLIRLED